MPLPKQVDSKKILDAVHPQKDVDGFHPISVGHLVSGRPALVACTPSGVMEILRRSGIAIEGANAVVMGRSDIVGKPMALLLMHANATVTICHSKTRDLPEVVRRADIVVAAMGRAAMVTGEYIRPGATVIDVGQNVITDRAEAERIFANFPEKLEAFAKKGLRAGRRRSSRRRQHRRRFHARSRRRRSADHRHAHEQHRQGGARAPRVRRRRDRCEALMLRAGLTGGIASGKSAVAEMMRELGCYVLDADRMAHRLIEPGQPAYDDVVREFGREILDEQGRIVRPKLADIVFADPVRLARLNAIVHPHVLTALDVELNWLEQSDPQGVAVVEAALLIESGYHGSLDRLIVVWCTPEQQLRA